jgi:hypothetical protein
MAEVFVMHSGKIARRRAWGVAAMVDAWYLPDDRIGLEQGRRCRVSREGTPRC